MPSLKRAAALSGALMSRALLSPADAARELCISESALQRLVSDGTVPSKWIAGSLHVDLETVEIVKEILGVLRQRPDCAIAWSIPKNRLSGVYFALAGDFVKIGIAKNIGRRMRSLQTSLPHEIKLICWEVGGRAEECALHSRFANSHIRGEWFSYSAEIRAYVAEQTQFYWGLR